MSRPAPGRGFAGRVCARLTLGAALLEAAARTYVNHPRGARVENGELTVSSLYAWYREDFGGTEAGVIAHLKRYAGPELAQALETVTDIEDYAYDWALNDAAQR